MIENSKSKLNESIGITQDDLYDELKSGMIHDEEEEEEIECHIKNFDDAAKILKCSSKDLINITEDDSAYNKIISNIKNNDTGEDVEMSEVNGLAGLYTLINGCNIVTTNEWGYGTLFVKKSEIRKAMKKSI